jgi:hypothetical protein
MLAAGNPEPAPSNTLADGSKASGRHATGLLPRSLRSCRTGSHGMMVHYAICR